MRVIITETLKKAVEINAQTEQEALAIVSRRYCNEEYVLSAEDYCDTTFTVDKESEDEL